MGCRAPLLARGGVATYEGTVPDGLEDVRERIGALADRHDVVLTIGGTSVGKKDYAVRALSDLGAVLFHRVRIRPGKPIAAARLPDHDAVAFAILGKPVGAHTVATLVVRPFFTGFEALTNENRSYCRQRAFAVRKTSAVRNSTWKRTFSSTHGA